MKDKYEKLIKNIRQAGIDNSIEFTDDMAYALAENLLIDEPWITDYLKSIGVTDILGRLASDI